MIRRPGLTASATDDLQVFQHHDGRPLSQVSKGLIDFFLIEADDHCVPDLGDWSCHGTKPLQFVNRRRIPGHITLIELYALFRKILFRPLAKHSAGLRKQNNAGTHSLHSVLP
jgi:hypothetical protein